MLTVVAYDGDDRSEPHVSDTVEVMNAAPRIVSNPMGFDGNAIYRHPDIMELRDTTEEDPKELEASKYDRSRR